MFTKDQVVDRMMTSYDRADLLEMCSESHKDFYGVRGHWMSGMSKPQLVSWWLEHYEWDEERQYWDCKESALDEAW